MGNFLREKMFYKKKEEHLENIPKSLFDISFKDDEENQINFKDFQKTTKLYLLVNVACLWSLSNNSFDVMNQFAQKYSERGLKIIAFPCLQFMKLEKANKAKSLKNKVKQDFMLTSIIEVNGEKCHPLFKYLRKNSELYNENNGLCKQIPWSFSKFILDREGKVLKFYLPNFEMKNIEKDILDNLD